MMHPDNCGDKHHYSEEPCNCGCQMFWGSHGCDLPYGHDGAHVCNPEDDDLEFCSRCVVTGPWERSEKTSFREDGGATYTVVFIEAPAEIQFNHIDSEPLEGKAFTWDNRVTAIRDRGR